LASSAVRATELVAIFTATIAFAVGSLQITLNGTLSLAGRVVLMAALGIGLIMFAFLIVGEAWFITRPPEHPHRRPVLARRRNIAQSGLDTRGTAAHRCRFSSWWASQPVHQRGETGFACGGCGSVLGQDHGERSAQPPCDRVATRGPPPLFADAIMPGTLRAPAVKLEDEK
jgi:hypothetical protein